MRAGIITHYDVHNHGAQLQLYALSKVLGELGYEAKALQFTKNYDFLGPNATKKYNISSGSFPFYLKYLRENGFRRTLYNFQKHKVLIKFRKENNLNGDFYSKAELLDLVVIGSDEIFSLESGLNPCFFGVGVRCRKIISYAASFGPTTLDFVREHNAEGFLRGCLSQINTILVRDANSKEIVETLTTKKASIVCDPVLLFDFWDFYQRDLQEFKSKIKKRYCLVYSYDNHMNDKCSVSSIKKYARERGLKIISVGFFHRWCDRNVQVSPLDLFKWFFGAEIVFTDTFHGTVVSMSMHSQFFSMVNGNGNKLESLLEQYGLKDRIVKDFSQCERFSEQIDYSLINKTIVDIRNDSLKQLKNAIASGSM